MSDDTRESTKETVRPNLGEALTVQRILEVKQALAQALSAGTTVTLDLKQVTEVDLTGLQLLCSAHRWAADRGRELAIADPGPALYGAARRSGFAGRKGCRSGCLWPEGEA